MKNKKFFLGLLVGFLIISIIPISLILSRTFKLPLYKFIFSLRSLTNFTIGGILTEIIIFTLAGFFSVRVSRNIKTCLFLGFFPFLYGLPIYTPPLWIYLLSTAIQVSWYTALCLLGGGLYLKFAKK